MAEKFKPGLVLACEHIVQGVGGKPTFIGVYTSDIVVPSAPASFWIAFFVELLSPESLPDSVRVSLSLNKVEFGKLEVDVTGIDRKQPLSIILQSGLLRIEGPSELQVTVSGAGFATLTAMKKNILVNPDHPALSN